METYLNARLNIGNNTKPISLDFGKAIHGTVKARQENKDRKVSTYLNPLPGEFYGWRSLVGPWDCKELDTTEQLHLTSPHLTLISSTL